MGEFILRILRTLFGAMPLGGHDAEAILAERAKSNGEDLDWRNSIVDLLKVLDMDSSYSSRRDLADELGYDGQYDGSAKANIWLHAEVMKRVKSGEYQ